MQGLSFLCFRRAARVLCGMGLGVWLGHAPAHGAELPRWLEPDCRRRAVFAVPRWAGSRVVLTVPLTADAERPAAFALFDGRNKRLSCRAELDVPARLVMRAAAPRSVRGRECVLYYGRAVSPEDAPDLAGAAADSVAVYRYRTEVKAAPASWARYRYMRATAGPVRNRSLTHAFSMRETERDRRRGGRWKAGRMITVLRSLVLVERPGSYRFAIDCEDAGFVSVDGRLAVAWPGEHGPGDLRLGAPFELAAGVHLVELANVHWEGRARMGLRWQCPGREDTTELPRANLLAAYAPDLLRIEQIDGTLHPGFTWEQEQAYVFRGSTAVFVPVRFEAATANWLGAKTECTWLFGDGRAGSGSSVTHVYNGSGTYTARLNVRDALGFRAQSARSIDCTHVDPTHFAAAFLLTDAPAVCYPVDKVAPSLRLRGGNPARPRVFVEWDAAAVRGRPENRHGRQVVTLQEDAPVRVALPAVPAGVLGALDWRVKHEARVVAQGVLAAVPFPFAHRPSRIAGDRMYDAAGRQLVLMPRYRAGPGPAPVRSESAPPARVVCVTDFLGAPVSTRDGPAGPAVFRRTLESLVGAEGARLEFVTLPRWETEPLAFGPLLKFVQVPAAVGEARSVVVLALGMTDFLARVEPAAFERSAAALADLLEAPVAHRVVWVTLPPVVWPEQRARDYAAAVQRVAVLRGNRVADLFSVFRGHAQSLDRLLDRAQSRFTERGARLAAQTVAHAVFGTVPQRK